MSSENLYEKYRIPVPEWRLRPAKKTTSTLATASPHSPSPPWVPKKKINFTQEELDSIIKEYPGMRMSYPFNRREAEVVVAASVGRAQLPCEEEWNRSSMEGAAKDIVKDWERWDEEAWTFDDTDDEAEPRKASKEQNQQLPIDDHVETWEELDEQKNMLEMGERAGLVQPDVMPEYYATASLEENRLEKRSNGGADVETDDLVFDEPVDVLVWDNKGVLQQTNPQFERGTKETVNVYSSTSLSPKSDSTPQEYLNSKTAENEIANDDSREEDYDLGSLFVDDGDDVVGNQHNQQVVVDVAVAIATISGPSSPETDEVALRSEDVRGTETSNIAATQQPPDLTEAGSFIPAAASEIFRQPSNTLQAPTAERNYAVSHLQLEEAAARYASFIKKSRLTFPDMPIQQSAQQTTHKTPPQAFPSSDVKTLEPSPQKQRQQPAFRAAFGPSQPVHLPPAPKRGPKQNCFPVPVLSPTLDQRCRQRLDTGIGHIRDFVKRKRGAAGPVPQEGKLVKKMEAVQKVVSTQEWRVYLERSTWEDQQRLMGSNPSSMFPPPLLGQGLADDVDTAMPEFLKQAIRAEKSSGKRARALAASSGPGLSHSAAPFSGSYGGNRSMTPNVGQNPMGKMGPPAHNQPQFGSFPVSPSANHATGYNELPQYLPTGSNYSGSLGASGNGNILRPPVPQMTNNPVPRGEPSRHPLPPQYAAAPQVPLPQGQQAGVPLGAQQITLPQLSPRGESVLNAWEAVYFAVQNQRQANTNQQSSDILDSSSPESHQKDRNFFRHSFYQNVAEFGEAQYIEHMRQETKREDLFGNHLYPQSSGTKRRVDEEEGEQEGRDTKRSRHQ